MGRNKEGQVATGYAVVWCRDFRLQAVRRHAGRQGPVALVDDDERRSIVLCANAAALRSGVEAGMPTVQAIARCPGLEVERPAAAAELAAGRLLLETALAWVPGVEETSPGILTLDLGTQPREQWFDGAWELREALLDRGLEIVVGLGETPALARLAAQAALHEDDAIWQLPADGRLERLDRLPVLLAETGAALRETLDLWGIRTLGAFARLRRDAVAARLGDEGVELWLRLNGQLRRPLRFVKLEELFETHHEFEPAVAEREPIVFLLRRFLGELCTRVGRTGRIAAAVHWLVGFDDGSCHGRRLVPPEPTLDEEVLFRLASGHLDTMEMKAAVASLRLRLEPADPVASQRVLFGAGLRNRQRCGETLTKLRKLVGADRVGSPRAIDSHRPGRFERAPLPDELGDAASGTVPAGPPATGPTLRRYPVACRAKVQVRDGQPLRVESARLSGVVVACQGPWKSGGDWWHRGRGWERTEWDVELLNHGLFRLVETEQGWSLEGYYD
jgi:protein ImuB